MIRIGYYGPGAFDLLHIGHLNLLRRAKNHCNFLIVGVVADEMLIRHKEVTPVSPLAERLEIICSLRFVDMAIPVMTNDKIGIWKDLHFNFLFKGSDWRDTEKGSQLEREFVPLRVDVAYFPYTLATLSSALRRTLRNIDDLASGSSKHTLVGDVSGRDGAESDQRRNCLLTRRRGNKRFPGDGKRKSLAVVTHQKCINHRRLAASAVSRGSSSPLAKHLFRWPQTLQCPPCQSPCLAFPGRTVWKT